MKWLPHSIRWRIQIWHGLLLLLVLTGFGVTAYQLQRANALRHLDSELQMRMAALHSSIDRHSGEPPPFRRPDIVDDLLEVSELPGLGPDSGPGPEGGVYELPEGISNLFGEKSGYYFSIWRRSGDRMGKSANAPADLQEPENQVQRQFRSREGLREIYEFTPPGECLLVGISQTAMNRELLGFAGWLTGIGGVVLILGLAGGGWLAARAIAPIQRISTAAARLAEGHFDERIPVAETDSELGQLTALLNDTFTRLDATFTEQARFTSDAAHELRTPVAIILAQMQLALARARASVSDQKTLEITQRSALRMQNLIESLLTLARLDGYAEPDATPTCDLAEISRENLEQIRPLAEERGIQLHSQFAPAFSLVHADKLTQILTNLLANAVKYSRPGDEVKLSTGRENGCALISVSDTGPGIAAEHLPHLFNRFYRADASRNRSTGGAGLGLAICKTLAENYGGKLEVQSTPGKGSTFTLRLPAVDLA